MKTSLLVLLISVSLLPLIAGDACSNLGLIFNPRLETIGSPLNFLACYHQVPFNQTAALQTLNVLSNVTQLYSFTELACYPPAGFNFTSCLPTAIANLAQKVNSSYYLNDYEFHFDVAAVFTGLKDAHTTYIPPVGYSECGIIREWTLTVDSVFGFTFTPDASSQFADYSGYQVTSINGMQPWNWIYYRANMIGFYKDFGVRLNAAINSIKLEDISFFNMAAYLQADTVQVQQGGNFKTLNIPVTVRCIGDRTTLAKVMQLNQPSTSSSGLLSKDIVRHHREKLLGTQAPIFKGLNPETKLEKNQDFVPIDFIKSESAFPIVVTPQHGDTAELSLVAGTFGDNSFLSWRYKGIPVWKITSFAPADVSDFLAALDSAIQSSANLQDKTLILDVS